jgi:hypothetical protein
MFLRHGEYSLLAFIGIGTATIGTLLFILLQREHSRHTAWLQNKSFKMASLETGWDHQAAPQEHHHRDAYATFRRHPH